MNPKRIVPAVLLLAFSALTAEEIVRHGYTAFLRLAATNLSAGIIFVDLAIALSLVLAWMIKDARQRGATVWPYAVLTLALGSVGPLAYLVMRSAPDRRADDAQKGAPRGLGLEANGPLA